MFLKTISFIVFSATCSSLFPVFGYAAAQSGGPGNIFSAFRKWPYSNYVDDQRRIMNRLQPFNNYYVDGRSSFDKFRALDGNHIPRISKVQKPHNELVENGISEDNMLLDRAAPCRYDEYTDDEYDNDPDYKTVKFNVYYPDGKPQSVNFEGKALQLPQY